MAAERQSTKRFLGNLCSQLKADNQGFIACQDSVVPYSVKIDNPHNAHTKELV